MAWMRFRPVLSETLLRPLGSLLENCCIMKRDYTCQQLRVKTVKCVSTDMYREDAGRRRRNSWTVGTGIYGLRGTLTHASLFVHDVSHLSFHCMFQPHQKKRTGDSTYTV